MDKVNIYFGAPLFNDMEQAYNAMVVDKIRNKLGDRVDIYLPQENQEINDKSKSADSLSIYYGDTERLKETDILIANLDGQVPDVGLATEVGYFSRMVEENTDRDRSIIGVYSDIRQGDVTDIKVEELDRLGESQWSYINLYLVGAVKSNGVLVSSTTEVIEQVVMAVERLEKTRTK